MKIDSIKVTAASNATPEVIKAWKAAHPRGVWQVAIDTDEEAGEVEHTDAKGRKIKVMKYKQYIGFVRKPTRMELSAAMTIKNDALKQAEEILRDCWLGGDEILLDDDDYFHAAVSQFSELMEVRNGEIKKL